MSESCYTQAKDVLILGNSRYSIDKVYINSMEQAREVENKSSFECPFIVRFYKFQFYFFDLYEQLKLCKITFFFFFSLIIIWQKINALLMTSHVVFYVDTLCDKYSIDFCCCRWCLITLSSYLRKTQRKSCNYATYSMYNWWPTVVYVFVGILLCISITLTLNLIEIREITGVWGKFGGLPIQKAFFYILPTMYECEISKYVLLISHTYALIIIQRLSFNLFLEHLLRNVVTLHFLS